MSNANRDYAIVYDVKNSSLVLSRPLVFYITDKNTSNIFVKLVTKVSVENGIDRYTNIENASNYVLTMRIIKPSNEVKSLEATQHEEGSIFQFDLTEDFKDIPGKYICELTISTIVSSRQELTTSDPFNYEVKRSILSNVGEIVETEDTTVEKLLNDLETTKTELSSQIKDIKKKFEFKKFKPIINSSPKFYSDDSTAPLGKRLYTLTKVEENLNKLKLLHVDRITFVIHVYKTSETELTPLETPEFLSQVYEICQRLNIKITALKFHQPTSLTAITSMTDFNTVYKNLISQYLTVAQNIPTIEYVTVFNEMKAFYGNVANHAYIIELYNLVKANGYKTGITLSLEDRNLMGSECDPLFSNSDAIFLNFYPILAYDLDVLNHQQMIDSVNYQLIKVLKYHKYNKPLILSECGCSDKDLALASPSKWGWSETGAVDSNGKSPYLFFKSIFNSEVNSGDISEMWLWFDYYLHYDFIYELFREFLSNK